MQIGCTTKQYLCNIFENMKTIAEITNLRKNGQLNDALLEIETLYGAYPHDYSVALCTAWVYVDAMKKYAHSTNYGQFYEYLNKFRTLKLDLEKEEILYNNVLWAVRLFLADYVSSSDRQGLNVLTMELHDLPMNRHCDAYRAMLSTAIKIKEWQGLPDFIKWWNLDNLRPEDYKKQEHEGKEFMSLAEATYNALCRCMLSCEDENKVLDFVNHVYAITTQHPEYQYLPYYNAKLLFKFGKTEQALETLKPFARKKASEFWVWQLLGDEVQDNSQKIMFYCKAALCGGKDEILVKMREQIGFYLIKNEHREMGKFLIEKVIDTRNRENRQPSYNIQSITKELWWKTTQAKWDKEYAEKKALGAEEFLFGKITNYEVLVTFVNARKGAVNFLTETKQHGFFIDHSKKIKTIKVNDLLRISATEIVQDGSTKIRQWKKIEDNSNPHFFKTFNGILNKNIGGFGFVRNIYVNTDLAKDIPDKQSVDGTAVLAFDKKKQNFGWNAISIKI